MNKNKLIAKQQLEIEELKLSMEHLKERFKSAQQRAIHVQQWSPKCPDFPRIAMNACIEIANQ